MNSISTMEILTLLAIAFFIFLLSLLYSYISTVTLRYFAKEPLPISKLWKKYIYIIILSKIISGVLYRLLETSLLIPQSNETINVLDIIGFMILVSINILLVFAKIKDKEQNSIGYKISTIIVLINYTCYLVGIFIFSIVSTIL